MRNSIISNARNVQTNNTVETNTMSNIKSIEIIVNLALSANGPSEAFLGKVQSDSKTLTKGRSLSRLRYKAEDDSVFATFVPLPEHRLDTHGRNNTAVVIFYMEDGSTKVLDATQTEEFWADVLDLEDGVDVKTIDFSAIVDVPSYDADDVREMLLNNEARAISIRFDGMPQFGTAVNKKFPNRFSIRPLNARVSLTSTTVGDDMQTISFSNKRNVLSVKTKAGSKFNATKFVKQTTSTKRRANYQTQAANDGLEMNFGGSTVVKPEVEETTPVVESVVETPAAPSSTDAKLDAMMTMLSNLQTQVTELQAENAKLREENEALKAAQTEPVVVPSAQVEAPTHVVEEVTPEPEVVEEEPTVEETPVEEAPAPKLSKAEEFRRRANAEKARRAAEKAAKIEATEDSDELDFTFNFNDDE